MDQQGQVKEQGQSRQVLIFLDQFVHICLQSTGYYRVTIN